MAGAASAALWDGITHVRITNTGILSRDLEREQAAVARGSGVSVDHIRALEGGRIPTPSFVTVARIARQLELRLDAVADETIKD